MNYSKLEVEFEDLNDSTPESLVERAKLRWKKISESSKLKRSLECSTRILVSVAMIITLIGLEIAFYCDESRKEGISNDRICGFFADRPLLLSTTSWLCRIINSIVALTLAMGLLFACTQGMKKLPFLTANRSNANLRSNAA